MLSPSNPCSYRTDRMNLMQFRRLGGPQTESRHRWPDRADAGQTMSRSPIAAAGLRPAERWPYSELDIRHSLSCLDDALRRDGSRPESTLSTLPEPSGTRCRQNDRQQTISCSQGSTIMCFTGSAQVISLSDRKARAHGEMARRQLRCWQKLDRGEREGWTEHDLRVIVIKYARCQGSLGRFLQPVELGALPERTCPSTRMSAPTF
jgi:hypothetical protein